MDEDKDRQVPQLWMKTRTDRCLSSGKDKDRQVPQRPTTKTLGHPSNPTGRLIHHSLQSKNVLKLLEANSPLE